VSAAEAAPEATEVPLHRLHWTRTPHGVEAGVSTRSGGVSGEPFASLNVSFTSGDRADRVVENRRRIARSAGYAAESAVLPVLEHGTNTVVVEPRHAGLGALAPAPPLRADALVTRYVGPALLATSADCAPVFLADREGRAVGIAHAGWRGAADGIVRKAHRRLTGLLPEDACILAAIGPCIGPCCFEVGPEVAERFSAIPHAVQEVAGLRPHVDLFAALRAQLVEAGAEVSDSRPPCTCCQSDRFFSHRAMGRQVTGRMLGFIFRRER